MLLKIRPMVRLFEATQGKWYYCVLSASATQQLLGFRGEQPGTRHTAAEVTIGNTTWKTNIIPDKERGWLFVIKADVRSREDIQEGMRLTATVKLLPGKGR